MADITINGVTVNPLAPSTAAVSMPATATSESLPDVFKRIVNAPAAADMVSAVGTKYILVQANRPLGADEKGKLELAGASILEYVPTDTYVCENNSEDVTAIQALPFVAWVGPYLRGFKISASLSPALAATSGRRMSLAEALNGPPPVLSDMPKTVDVIFHRGTNVAEATGEVAQVAGLDPMALKPAGAKVRLTVRASQLTAMASIDAVRNIEEVYPAKLHNNVAREILGIDSPNPGPLPFDGTGQVVAVADSGFDRGSITNVHPAFTGRVDKLYSLGRPGSANDPHGHGTHVAGSVLGDGNSAQLGVQVRGTATGARLVLQSLMDSFGGLGGIPADLHDLLRPPYDDDAARIHTNSWGSTVGDGRYDSQAFEVDDFIWEHRDCVVCFSAGNEGIDADADGMVDPTSITPPGTAKNCITIGASENNRPTQSLTYGLGWPSDFPQNPLSSDRTANNPNGIVAFSSRGPTKDQRFKPDVVAPGTFVLSARSRDTTKTGWGLPHPAETAYMYDGGTSMATPLVAGCCALIRQYLIDDRQLHAPSAALVKAMLINGAVDLPGQYVPSEAGPIPNFAEGFGRVDMNATLGAGTSEIIELRDEARKLDTADEETIQLQIPVGASELKVTLVWTDPPGATLQNDLDLIVRAGGQERHGNVAAGSADFDRVNNVEQVVWNALSATSVDIVIKAFRVTSFHQPFALVVRVR